MIDPEKMWEKALRGTEIIRARIQMLHTNADTSVSYIMLSESSINLGDTVVRKGKINVDRPALIVPPNNPQFKGFEFEDESSISPDSIINFLLIRGISIPSLHYDNRTSSLDVYEDKLSSAVKHYEDLLQREENTKSGLIIGPEDCWQFSLLIFICSQIAKNADNDIRRLLNDYKNKGDND